MALLHVEGGWDTWIHGVARETLEREVLPGFLPRQRWFAGKARALERVRIVDETAPGALPGTTVLLLIEARFRDGGRDIYLLPLGVATGASADPLRNDPRWFVADLAGPEGRGVLYDALADDAFCEGLLDAMAQGRAFRTRQAVVKATPTTAFAEIRGPSSQALPIRRGSSEQSNSAILYGERLFLKVFRRLEPGLNPDLEIGRFLTDRARFRRVPRTAGAIERIESDQRSTLAILQELVGNQGTGWEHALEELARYFERVRSVDGPPPALDARSPLDLAGIDPPESLATILGAGLDEAATLGRRTAELHEALAGDPNDPAFAPEPLTHEHLERLAGAIRAQVGMTLAALEENLDRLPESIQADARRVLNDAPRLLARLETLKKLRPSAKRIRVHGDYHLGQLLWVDSDYMILDFEGEPAKPLAQRLEKQPAVKDVVGMLRSFDYAAHAGLFAATARHPEDFDRLMPWARAWAAWTSAAFLNAYFATAIEGPLPPRQSEEFARLLEAYTLDKALYELLYELNNRPDWVRIPLQGILGLLATG